MERGEWISVKDRLPPEGEVVKTIIDDAKGKRNDAFLIRKGNLWFFKDMSMYVYYRPTHWQSGGPTSPPKHLSNTD